MSSPKPKKIALGMSGGVDSSVCAHLLKNEGYEVTGVFLECWRAPGCRSDEDRADALKVALSLNIPFRVLDFKQAYKDKVVEYFFTEYQAGRTPNPDVLCNSEIKFGLFYDWAMVNGFDAVATGHYAATLEENNHTYLSIPQDRHKDQTYFLYLLRPDQLKHVLFPLSRMTKQEVRDYAKQHMLHVANKKDSVGICFIGDIDVGEFLKERLGEKPGDVVNSSGDIIGRHRGLWFYTIGQRHGFIIDKKTVVTLDSGEIIEKQNIPPFYVISKQIDSNTLIVGFGVETFNQTFFVHNIHTLVSKSIFVYLIQRSKVRIRHTGELLLIDKVEVKQQGLAIQLKTPTKGIAEGQSAVFYSEDKVIGGGIVSFTI